MKLGAKRRSWTAEEDAAVQANYGCMSAAEVGKLIRRSESAVWGRVRALGLEKRQERHDPWTEAELEEVRRCYSAERPSAIAKRLGRTVAAVSWQAQRMGVPSGKALIAAGTVHDYFGAITTAEQAYILGLLAADGCVDETHPRLQFGLVASDGYLVEWVRDRLNPKATVHSAKDGRSVILITSAKMVADLAPFGIVPRKSRTIRWPAELGPLLRPFLAGHFDGDGWTYVVRGKYPGWGTCSGSLEFMQDMKAYIYASTGVTLEKIQHRPDTNLWQVAKTGSGAVVLDEWLHRDGFGLARKRIPAHILSRYAAV